MVRSTDKYKEARNSDYRNKASCPSYERTSYQSSATFSTIRKGSKTKLTLITAPAGYGKSTLLSEWIKTLDVNIAWVSLDENDNDPTRFWKHTIEALNQSLFKFVHELGWYHEMEELEVASTSSITKLINRLNQFSENIVLTWDDFHWSERQGDSILLLLQYSMLLADKGEATRSLDILEEALSLAEANHYTRTLLDAGKAITPLLQFYLVTRQKQQREPIHQVSLTFVKDLLNDSLRSKTAVIKKTTGEIYLTDKERLVLQHLTTSLTNKEIASELGISLSTIKTHINNIYGKLDVSNRMEAIEQGKLFDFI